MPLLDQQRAEALIKLACQRFDPEITDAELQVLRDSASSVDLEIPEEDAPRPTIRPEFLRWLATDKDAAPLIDPKGLRVVNFVISDSLDLDFCHIPLMLVFRFCTIQGQVLLKHASLRGIAIYDSCLADGLVAQGAEFRGPVFLGPGFHSTDPVDFHSAHIEGNFQCMGKFARTNSHCLSLEGARVRGSVFFANNFRTCGEIRLVGAEIGGDLDLRNASLNAVAMEKALSADRAEVGGNIFLTNAYVHGNISLNSIEVGGQFNCNNAALTGNGKTLELEGATIQGFANLQGLRAMGQISALGAKFLGGLDCSRAVLTQASDYSFLLDRSVIHGSVFFRGLRSDGAIKMTNTSIDHSLDCRGARIASLECRNMKVGGEFVWTSIQNPGQTTLNLGGVLVGRIRDDKESWPASGRLTLDGMVYDELCLHPPSSPLQLAKSNLSDPLKLDALERIKWLMIQAEEVRMQPQPWMQLAKLLESRGDRKDAKHVIYKFRCMRTKSQKKWWAARRWAIFFAWLEETPIRITRTIALTVLIGLLIFGNAGSRGALAPTQREAYDAFISGKPMPSAYPVLNPFVYALENTLPLVKLGQDDKWAPDHRYQSTGLLTNYWFLMWTRWILILTGWVQATIFVAAVADRFKK